MSEKNEQTKPSSIGYTFLNFTTKVEVKPTKRDIYADEIAKICGSKSPASKDLKEHKHEIKVMLESKPDPVASIIYVRFEFDNVDEDDLSKVLESTQSLIVTLQGKLRAAGEAIIRKRAEEHNSKENPFEVDVHLQAVSIGSRGKSKKDPEEVFEETIDKMTDEQVARLLEKKGYKLQM